MDDFLYNVRTGNQKRTDGNRKQYNSYNNRGYDKQRGKEGRNGYTQRGAHQDQWSLIKKSLEDLSENQKRIAVAGERRAKAAERLADAMENISICLGHVATPEVVAAADTDVERHPVSSPEDEQREPETTPPEPETTPPEPETPPVEISAETEREKTMDMILEMRIEKVSYAKIAAHLSSMAIPTFSGRGQWQGYTVSNLCAANKAAR